MLENALASAAVVVLCCLLAQIKWHLLWQLMVGGPQTLRRLFKLYTTPFSSYLQTRCSYQHCIMRCGRRSISCLAVVVSDCSVLSPHVVKGQCKLRNKVQGTAAVKSLLIRVCIPVAESVNADYSAAWRGWHEQCQHHQIQTSFKLFAQQKSCWSSQQSATKSENKARAKLWQNSLHKHSCILCKPLQVFAL